MQGCHLYIAYRLIVPVAQDWSFLAILVKCLLLGSSYYHWLTLSRVFGLGQKICVVSHISGFRAGTCSLDYRLIICSNVMPNVFRHGPIMILNLSRFRCRDITTDAFHIQAA